MDAGPDGSPSTGSGLDERAHARQRWAARASLTSAGLAVIAPIVTVESGGPVLVIVGALSIIVMMAALWWTLTRRGWLRFAAGTLAVAAPAASIALFAVAQLLWLPFLLLALWALAVWTGKVALSGTRSHAVQVVEYETPPPARPFLIMNPRSGGGKVERFGLKEKAERLGARVHLLDTSRSDGPEDVAALARAALDEGADLLGVAGGDGTQALVAAVAAEHDVPFLVVSAGTRNHFAMDLGLDREDPSTCLDALSDGVELRVDLGFADDHPFVNNASFGAYAAVVQSPEYRDDKVRTTLDLLPELLTHERGPVLTARVAGTGGPDIVIDMPQALLVSNNPYRTDDFAGLGRRERLDLGVLGVLGVKVEGAAQAAELLLGRYAEGLTAVSAREVVVECDRDEVEVGVDGEALILPAPVRCRIRPRALRVRVPRDRPGVPEIKPPLEWRRLRKLAATVGRTALPKSRHPKPGL
ncbi:diacylglycerol/lipid kinase family protein [Streptomyces sp. NPDC058964]|uniref:diacylglycerol/lipid kinase family protein n=1 Tax=Streptomyces sp. NPDC058964 TaxID=3346681 RepID=UPI00369913A6